MTRLRALLSLVLVVLAACSDGPSGPAQPGSISILRGSVPSTEETIGVGETVQLRARVNDSNGKEMPDRRPTWSSTAAQVATVDTAGLVRGVQLGTALIIATSDGVSDTTRINVAAPVSGAIACNANDTGISLGVGQVHTTTADRAVHLCINGGGGSEYVLIPFNGSLVAGSHLEAVITGVGTIGAQGPPNPSLSTAGESGGDALRADEGFHQRLNERTVQRLGSPDRTADLEPSFSRALAAVPTVGELLRLNVETRSQGGCSDPDLRTGRVVAVSTRAVIVADTANPRNGYTEEDYRQVGQIFDELIYPLSVRNFGEPSDIDTNQRVLIFFTRAVNELTARGSSSYVGGFFFNRDLFPKTGTGACAGSNAAEILYMLVPDPTGLAGNSRSVEFVKTKTAGVLAHELQHLINDSRRKYVNSAGMWEERWLNEGLSHIAEELMFYEASRLTPRSNIDGRQLQTAQVRQAFQHYQSDNVDRLVRFLDRPQTASLMGEDELPTRGAAWSFLRYAADRRGGDERELWNRLVNSKTAGLENVTQVFGASALDWMQDWAVSLYTDDAGLPVEPQYTQPSWNHRVLIPYMWQITGGARYSQYPLRTLTLTANAQQRVTLLGGGTAFIRFGIAAGERAAIRTTVGDLPAPSRLRLAVVRTK